MKYKVSYNQRLRSGKLMQLDTEVHADSKINALTKVYSHMTPQGRRLSQDFKVEEGK